MMRFKQAGNSLVVAAALALLAAGCSSEPDGAAAASSEEEITLTYWGTYGNGGNTAQTDVLDNLIPQFEEANPGITVQYVDVPYDDLQQKLTTSAAGDELPDLLRSDINWVAQFAELGVFAQLDGMMDGFDELAAAVYPGTLATNRWDGHYYGLPLNTNTRVLITSQEALDAAGMDGPPVTFGELADMAAALEGNGMQVFADGGLQGWNIFPWIWSGGGQVTDEDLTTATGYLDGPASVAAVQMLVDLYQAGQIPNLIIGNEGATSTSDGVPSGDYATILDGPWMRDIWSGQYPDFTPIYAAVPAGDGGSISVVGGESIVMMSSTPHQEAALKFIEFTQSRDYQLGMAAAGQMTVVQEFGQEDEIDPFYAIFAEQLETARPRLAIPGASQVDGILQDALTPAFEGQITVQEALSNAAAQIDPLLAAGQ
jgi:multiple sugar transport system substrate-binding protein